MKKTALIILLLLISPPAWAQVGRTPAWGQPAAPRVVQLIRYVDRSEQAFSVSVPAGWRVWGGIERVNPLAAGGPSQSIEARLNFAVMNDPQGTVMIRWLPHTYYADLRGMPAAPMFPPGSRYRGMPVLPAMDPLSYLQRVLIPQTHQGAQNLRVVEQRRLPRLTALFQNAFNSGLGRSLPPQLHVRYAAGLVSLRYLAGGIDFLAKIVVVLEYRPAARQWTNRFTLLVRTPAQSFRAWAPLLTEIAISGELNPAWMARELQGQMHRGRVMRATQAEIHRLGQDIVRHRQRTNALIANQMFLDLTGQEQYIDPHTGRRKTGSNTYNQRWINREGKALLTNDPNFDPNRDRRYQRWQWQRAKRYRPPAVTY